MPRDLGQVDFGLDAMPGPELHEVLAAYREAGPVQPTRFGGNPAFVVTSYAALLEAFQDDRRFPGERMYELSFEPAIGQSFISMPDPEPHRVYRKLATPAFRSRAMESYERKGMVELAHELIDGLLGLREFDLMPDFVARFPYLVITRLLGLPRHREDEFHAWAMSLLGGRYDPQQAQRANRELTSFLRPIVEERRREPQGDVISELIQSEVDGRALTDEEIHAHVRLLFPTGGETTHGTLGNLFYALFTQGDTWRLVCDDPSRIPDAVDEVLRWESSIAVLPRMSRNEPTPEALRVRRR